jgi:antitoxin YefM
MTDPHRYSMAEARDRLTQLPEELEALKNSGQPPVIQVTRRNIPALAIVSWELYESIMETLEILGNEELTAQLRQAIKEVAEGQGKPLSEIVNPET